MQSNLSVQIYGSMIFLEDMTISNEQLKNYPFLQGMYDDKYFPNLLVDKGKQILIRLCEAIESQQPKDSEDIFRLTHSATNEFNDLDREFQANGSELETVARDVIGTDFDFIVKSYGFDVDSEEVIATRDW